MANMTAAVKLVTLKDNLKKLGFRYMAEEMDQYLDELQKGKMDVIEFLNYVSENEIAKKATCAVEISL